MSAIDFSSFIQEVLEHGAAHANVISVSDISFHPELRDACKQNHCGQYGRNWTCPPGIGEIEDLIEKLKAFSNVLVFQTISDIEDSFDFEGMMAASKKHQQVVQSIRNVATDLFEENTLLLGAGGCPICQPCAMVTDEPCRYPDLALSSLEAHGIHVAKLAEASGMNYINGANTVTYFGGLFF